MYNSSDIADKIKLIAKSKDISVKRLLEDVGLGFNTMSNMKTSMPKVDNLAKIADYLDCSVDYLLGRENRENNKAGIDIVASKVKGLNMENYNEKTSVLVSNVEDWNVKNDQEKNKDLSDEETEILGIYRSLNIRDKSTFLNFILNMEKEKNN